MGASVELIVNDSLRASEDGFEIQVRLNWYRSLPLSCVEDVSLALDGESIDKASIRFGINEHEYALDGMADLVDESWFVQDYATLTVKQPGKVYRGEKHTVDAQIFLRAPYIPVGPGKFLTMPTRYSTVQVAA